MNNNKKEFLLIIILQNSESYFAIHTYNFTSYFVFCRYIYYKFFYFICEQINGLQYTKFGVKEDLDRVLYVKFKKKTKKNVYFKLQNLRPSLQFKTKS